MDTLDAIFTRRSIRKYADQPVTDDLVNELLRAAMAAPSAGNEQAWQLKSPCSKLPGSFDPQGKSFILIAR